MSRHAKPFEALITVDHDAGKLAQLFAKEDKSIQNGRAALDIRKKGERITFTVHADDATALRSMTSMVLKNLAIYDGLKPQ